MAAHTSPAHCGFITSVTPEEGSGLKRHDEVHLLFAMLLCHNCITGEGEKILLQNELTNILDGVKIQTPTVNKK